MDTTTHTPRMVDDGSANAVAGHVRWAPVKSAWYLSHLLVAIVGGALTLSWTALAIFLISTAATLCLGHSLGMHRRLIHHAYECPRWLEYLLVHLGVLVGMAGPRGMAYQHDIRDWAQRKPQCHSFLRHGESFLRDGWWQLNCELQLAYPPHFQPETRIDEDAVLRFMERTWMLQQLPWALLLYAFGGFGFVVWGISVRVAVELTGHWLIGYFAHNAGSRDWHIEGAAVQGYNIPLAGVLTMGESWHNNHHAYPGSARLGIYEDQPDPGWWVLKALHRLGLVWSIRLPEDLPQRAELRPAPEATHQRQPTSSPRSVAKPIE